MESLLKQFDIKSGNGAVNKGEEINQASFYTSVERMISELNIDYRLADHDVKNIPIKGAFIAVANRQPKLADMLILAHAFLSVRSDVLVVTDQKAVADVLAEIAVIIKTEDLDDIRSDSLNNVKKIVHHLRSGSPVIIFPASDNRKIISSEMPLLPVNNWDDSLVKFMHKISVPIVPTYLKGQNRQFVQFLTSLKPVSAQGKAKQFRKQVSSKNTMHLRIGSAIIPSELKELEETALFKNHLYSIVYALGTTMLKSKKIFQRKSKTSIKEQLINPESPALLTKIIDDLKSNGFMLFNIKNYEVFCAPSNKIGAFLYEIGRLREQTYREVGEGTHCSYDLDEYDSYYHQLFIWDSSSKQLVGGYRVGFGHEIMLSQGEKGFYSNTLFAYQKEFHPHLSKSLELGRSFIVKDYQRKGLPLFMLWKGILFTLLNNPHYRYLMGPVSISADFSETSKALIVEFIRKFYFNKELSASVKPRIKVKLKKNKANIKSILNYTEGNIDRLDKTIKRLEVNNNGVPVLIRKYLELQGTFLGFNLDPDFNNCIDGLFMVDLKNIPEDMVKAFSKER